MASYELTNGNFIALQYDYGSELKKSSGLKKTDETWVFKSPSDIMTTQPPSGVQVVLPHDYVEFTSMNGGPAVIDRVWLRNTTPSDLTGLCK
jgi:hypothetical protein